MDLLLVLAGLAFGAMIPALCIWLTRRRFPTLVGALATGFFATLAGSYAALRLSFWAAERFVSAEVVPQWEAQGHFDNGPSAFVAIGSLAMPVTLAAFAGGIITTVIVLALRMAK